MTFYKYNIYTKGLHYLFANWLEIVLSDLTQTYASQYLYCLYGILAMFGSILTYKLLSELGGVEFLSLSSDWGS